MNTLDSLWIITNDGNMTELGDKVDSLQCQLNALSSKTDMLSGIIETSNSSIANQLSAANTMIAVVAILFAIFGGFLGLYIRRKKLEVEAMAKLVDEKKKTVDEIAATTKSLDEQIHNNLSGLYQKLRTEETNAILDRLIIEPRDITNLLQLLLSRDVEETGYIKLKEAYLKLINESNETSLEDYKESYILLFFQHYCHLALKDGEIRPALVDGFIYASRQAFKRDIIKTTIDLCKAISDNDSSFNKETVLIAYLKALNHSKHRKLDDLKNLLEQNITPPTLLEKAKDQCLKDGEYLALFGMEKEEDKQNSEEV